MSALYEEVEIWEIPDEASLDMIERLKLQTREEEGQKPTGYFFKDYSFVWLLEHDEQLQKIRHESQHRSPEDRRMAADHEYHATIAHQLFLEIIGNTRPTPTVDGRYVPAFPGSQKIEQWGDQTCLHPPHKFFRHVLPESAATPSRPPSTALR